MSKNKKTSTALMAHQAGFKPTTPWFDQVLYPADLRAHIYKN